MSLLKPKLLYVAARNLSLSAPRAGGVWNKDWKPKKYPQTEEERLAAAKKYGLLPQEYEPTPDDGQGSGDYPHLKEFSVEARDPFYPWDFPEYRRNFGEVLHQDANLFTEDRYNVNMRPRYPLSLQMAAFLGVIGVSWWLMKISKNACMYPVAKLHLPAPGVKHYSYD
uniref:NADH-ubiquinone oxidoreductase ashi subunit n=1 Tax=Riptortus pedestris TaxID=329032 RepID=R4WSR8_RIPPE|nr:NADH-ubiquinone oxidoreductase ashi subunit [Riptortus pedestris]